MKLKIFKKLTILLGLGLGVFTLASCQSANPDDAKIVTDLEHTAVEIYKESTTGKVYATATVGVANNSIYDVLTWNFDVTTTNAAGVIDEHITWESAMYVGHGASGYVTLLNEVEDTTVTSIKINSITRNQYRNVWTTYLAWWIVGIAMAVISIISFGFMVFSGRLTAEQTKLAFKENVSGLLWTASFVLLLCLFPLCFGSWVPTVIFAGAVLSSLAVEALLTYLKTLISKE